MLENDYPNENLINNKQGQNSKENESGSENNNQKDNIDQKINNNTIELNEQKEESNENISNEKKTVKNHLPSAGDEVIEDNIKKSDTIILDHNKKKKGIDDKKEEEVIYEGDEDLNSNNKNKKAKNNNFRYHININQNFLKYLTIVIIIIYIIIAIAGCIIFHNRRDKYPFLFCFGFLERFNDEYQDMQLKDNIYFLTDLNSFYIIHLVFLFLFISICYMLIKGRKSDIDSFFKDMSIFFISTLIFNIPIFISGMLTKIFYGNHLQPMAYLALTFLGFLSMIKIFVVAKRHKHKNITRLLNISILTSFMTAYHCYCFIFCLCYSYMNFYKPVMKDKPEDNNKEYPEIEIIAGCAYFAIGIIVMTVFKDIFFVIAMIIIQNGFLYTKKISDYLLTNAIVNISMVSLNFASIIIIIFAYNKKVFRLKEQNNN